MALTQRLEFRQSQSLVMTPQLMQAIKLLQLSNLDLVAFVEDELERNPLLERANQDGAPDHGDHPAGSAEGEGDFSEGAEFTPGSDGERSGDGFEAGAEEWMAPDLGSRTGAGLFGAFNLGPVVLLGEVDYFDDESVGDGKLLASLAEADWKIRQGHNLKLTYEWLEPNDDVDEDEQTRSSLLYEWSPIQFVQVRAGVRVYDGIPQNDNQNRTQAFLQLHGFF